MGYDGSFHNIDYLYFALQLSQKGIPVKTWEEFTGMSKDEFFITTPIVYKVLSIFDTLVIMVLGGMYFYSVRVLNMAGMLLIFGIIIMLLVTVDLFIDKTEVSGSQLTRKRMFRKLICVI